jgi:hypothetical protein
LTDTVMQTKQVELLYFAVIVKDRDISMISRYVGNCLGLGFYFMFQCFICP